MEDDIEHAKKVLERAGLAVTGAASGEVDPYDPKNWYVTLWCVIGPDYKPAVFALQIDNNNSTKLPRISGYKVELGVPSFTKDTKELSLFFKDEITYRALEPKFFGSQHAAMEYLKLLTMPRAHTKGLRRG